MKVQFDITPSELGSNCNDSFWKRLRGGIEGIDNDYESFLEYLNGSRERTTTVGKYAGNDEKEEEEEEEGVDPDYEKFMNQLTQCGKSYALKVHEAGGMLVLVKYDGVDDSDEYWDPPARRKLSKGRNVGEGLCGAKELRNLQSEEHVENWGGLSCLLAEERKTSLLKKVLNCEYIYTESCDTEGCRKRGRADWESNQMAEPHELLNGPSLRQTRSGEGVNFAVTDPKVSVENKKVKKTQIFRSTGEREQSNSLNGKDLRYEIGMDPPLRKSRNAIEREMIEVITPLRNVYSDKKDENKRISRSTQERETRTSIAEKEPRHEPASDFVTRRRPMNDNEDCRTAEKRRILMSDCRGEKMQTVAEKKIKSEPLFSPQACSKSRHVIKREQIELSDHQRDVERNIKLADQQNLRSNLDKERSNLLAGKKLRSETMNHVSHRAKACPRQRFVVEDDDMSEHQRNCKTNDIEIDGCYQTFLNGIQNEGECLVFVQGGKRVVYENDYIDSDSDSDSEILMWSQCEFQNQNNYNPFVLRKQNLSIDEEDNEKEVALFRREVISVLERPYDDKEYKKLLRDIKIRKPVEVHREMRRPKSVPVDRLGKSYLDHHPDLKRKIVAVKRNRPKVLNILRGFFFWMNNVCHEGRIFKPWKDASCLAVLPTSK